MSDFENDMNDPDEDELMPSDKIEAIKEGDQFYKVTLLLRVPKEVYDEWDSGCDETFHLMSSYTDDSDMVAYEHVDRKYYENHIHDIFDRCGGI